MRKCRPWQWNQGLSIVHTDARGQTYLGPANLYDGSPSMCLACWDKRGLFHRWVLVKDKIFEDWKVFACRCLCFLDVFICNATLLVKCEAFCEAKECTTALQFCLQHMQSECLSLDAITYAWILRACSLMHEAKLDKEIHDQVAPQGLLKTMSCLEMLWLTCMSNVLLSWKPGKFSMSVSFEMLSLGTRTLQDMSNRGKARKLWAALLMYA